jgi:membrane peptidoglycan carboxypeptidase
MAVDVPSGERLQYNLAAQGHPQADSAVKPFTLAAALEHGKLALLVRQQPAQLTIPDPRCQDGCHQPWLVHNNADETAAR